MTPRLLFHMDVLTALTYACSQNPAELKAGEQQLKAWEKERGYYAGLAVSYNVLYNKAALT